MKLTIIEDNVTEKEFAAGQSVLEILTANGIYINAPCGGLGRCGKCKILLVNGTADITVQEMALLSEKELSRGIRLACEMRPRTDCMVRLLTEEDDFEVLSQTAFGDEGEKSRSGRGEGRESLPQKISSADGQGKKPWLFAIDIGTTTLAVSLIDCLSGKALDTFTGINHQRAYGGDVISRIHAYDEGKGGEMTASIKKDLLEGMQMLLSKHQIDGRQIEKVVIAGNTTMGHLLLGYDCHGLGRMPFTPVNLEPVELSFEELFENDLTDAAVTVLPGFSAFVGADIVSGLLCCGFYEAEKPSFFIDLGTNGEMAIGNRERLLVTSTAAGPAFEGGNISWGVGSVGGAIYQVDIRQNEVKTATILNKPPVGICGTGVIETTASLLQEEIMDETGLLDEDYFDDGYVLAQTEDGRDITFTQKDIRELQLAKAAVRAGMETLLVRYGVGYNELEHVYVAGGFGVHLNMEKAAAIGLIPQELLGKVKAVGNTSLGGAGIYGRDPEAEERCRKMIACGTEVDLSTDKSFQEFYVDSMFFE